MKKKSILILIILLTIGFAAVSTTMYLNGNVIIGTNMSDYDVIFTEALVDGVESSKATISEDKKTITFTSNKLTKAEEKSVLDYKVKNNSTQFGAEVIINCTIDESEYIKVTNELDSKSIPLNKSVEMEAQEVKSGKITAELIKSYTGEETSINITCELIAGVIEKDTITEYVPHRYREEILNGADPVIGSGLIPVTIENDGTVKKADITSEWYDYETKRWANAVILEDETVDYSNGEVIPESNIESYFVWIPKYKYKLWNVNNHELIDLSSYNYDDPEVLELTKNSNAQTIDIIFGTDNTTDIEGISCVTPMKSGETGTCNNEEYMTHPAFISIGVNGLWVGKYETGYKEATTPAEAEVNVNDSSKIIIKPNVYSWRNIKVSNIFYTSYNYVRNLNSHMLKRSEWGAVAYLSHSKYGIDKEVNINNNSSFKTGYSGLTTLDQSSYPGTFGDGVEYNEPYNTEVGYLASTTGNISGVYDMSGGSSEYLAGYLDGEVRFSGLNLSEIRKEEYSKYFDIYASQIKALSYQYRILGDATGELSPSVLYKHNYIGSAPHSMWYYDLNYLVDKTYAWARGGGSYKEGVLAGQFYSSNYQGEASINNGFRLVLAP